MGRLIKTGPQERRLLRPKRLHWSRLLFLLGMLIIGSFYQHLRRPHGLPSLWAAVSSQQPVQLAGRGVPDDEVMTVSSDPLKTSSELQGEMQAPKAPAGREEVTPTMTTKNTPRRTAKVTPSTPRNHSSLATAGRERRKGNTPTTPSGAQNHYVPTSSRQAVKTYTPTFGGEMKNDGPTNARGKVKKYTPPAPAEVDTFAPSTFTTMETSRVIAPRTAGKDGETVAAYKILEANALKRIAEDTTPTTLGVIVDNTPTFLTHEGETNILTSAKSTVEKNSPTTSSREGKNSSVNPWRSVGNSSLTTPQETALEHTPVLAEDHVTRSPTSGSSRVETEVPTAAWRIRGLSPRAGAPAIQAASAPSASADPRPRANPTMRVRHCVVVEPAPARPATHSPGLSTTLFPEPPGPSPSALSSTWPGLSHSGEYPQDLFSLEDRRQGWVVLHIFGMMYLFVALAIVCDEFFVPALGVITDKLQISDDVAGATFMAAGGSAPELFTSLIGVFISHSNVGIGTIVGSAVFNILFVIGTCSLFSQEILSLTWWPLFRDVSFYFLDLMMLILFFLDSLIAWWESLLLLLAYALYVLTMKWNRQIERWAKEQLSRRPAARVTARGDLSKLPSVLTRESSSSSLHNSTIRSTIYRLMLHSLDPLGEAHVSKDKEGSLGQAAGAQPQAKEESKAEVEEPAKLPAVSVTPDPAPDVRRGQEKRPGCQEGEAGAECTGEGAGKEGEARGKSRGASRPEGKGDAESTGDSEIPAQRRGHGDRGGRLRVEGGHRKGDDGGTEGQDAGAETQGEANGDEKSTDSEGGGDGGESESAEEEDDDEGDEPLSLDWPETRQKQAVYLFLLPVVLPLWLTVPDVRRQESRKFFLVTFLGAIIWIAVFSYLMVWWAHQVGETIGISEEIMGLTILAAGTSIPDLITSVIVARKGLGDMAVSSSVGSNIFDITVGLPAPWLLFSLLSGLQPVPVSSNGLFCAIVLLFLMLLFVISSIASCKWKMSKRLGFAMFLLYFVFLIISVLLEERIMACPVSL
ncbi:sodium/potassium/calcium exchanger 1 isoform X2 [Tupaia chinensis]|uniref:sodium/potassium/calcium exchanger 1 isoform X2 n=1 Tax=Tupaia chinensis TaxID=246437 RepID=UPI000703FA1C|nr:sodium/potassium/calcium exchanger 1 isoform X2 [Tupaia chinensis]